MKEIYLIGNAHLDPVWLWRKREGMAEVLSTFRSALDRMKEFPDYVFTAACASYYRWTELNDPDMFEEIKERVKEGRWVIVGGYWIQPDCNIPSGEAFARQGLYSQRYFREKFGVQATLGYNVDSFGHNGMYPQLLRQAGMDNYVFMRPDMWENAGFPGFLFTWQSPDGSRVKVGRISHGYANYCWGQERYPEYEGLTGGEAKILHLKRFVKKDGHPYMCFYGVGNHGGGPTVQDLKALSAVVQRDDTVVFASPEDYFRDTPNNLPLWESDLQHHASGCYAANSSIKMLNRRSEGMLQTAEQFSLMASRLVKAPPETESLKSLWEKVMFNQFHDILAGCTIYEATCEAEDAFRAACDGAAEITMLAAQRIARKIRTTNILDHSPAGKNGWILWETEGEGAPIIVFNPHAFPVKTQVQINTTVIAVTDAQGVSIPWQYVRGPQTNGGDHLNTLFTAEVPAWGWSVYHIFGTHEMAAVEKPRATAGEWFLENDRLRAEFSPETGCITSIKDKETGRELCASSFGGAVLIENEDCDTWSHGKFLFDKVIDRFELEKMDVLEQGPVRSAIRVVSRCRNSKLTQIYYLSEGKNQVEVSCGIDLREDLKIVKLCFDGAVQGEPMPVYSMPSGFLEKQEGGKEQPAHEWAAVRGEDGKGFAILNNGRYSFSVKGGELAMTAARSAIFADHFGQRDDRVRYMDQGLMDFEYAIAPYDAAHVEETASQARLLNRPLYLVMEGHHDGVLPPTYSGISISTPRVIVQAAKESEDGQATIVRLLEVSGQGAQARVTFPLLGGEAEGSFRPQEIKTLRIDKKTGEIRESNFLED